VFLSAGGWDWRVVRLWGDQQGDQPGEVGLVFEGVDGGGDSFGRWRDGKAPEVGAELLLDGVPEPGDAGVPAESVLQAGEHGAVVELDLEVRAE
jgi:hypothetical protein